MKHETSNSFFKLKLAAILAIAGLMPVLAQAHPFHGVAQGFTGGLSHPLTGLDHILAMVAVGLWAAQLGGRCRWAIPATFVGLMTVGGALGMSGVYLPGVESGIAASVLVLGVFIAAAVRLPMFAGMAMVGLFAIFHGHAHGAEMPHTASGLTYAMGFILATIALHAAGVGLGMAAQKRASVPALRFAGAAIAVAGICMWVA